MPTPGLTKTFIADVAIGARRIVKFGSSDSNITLCGAAPATAGMLGVSDRAGDAVAGDRVDVIMDDIAEVVLGGTVTRGDPLTSDASGAAVTANPAAGVNVYIVGMAMMSGVAGDIIDVDIDVDRIQG